MDTESLIGCYIWIVFGALFFFGYLNVNFEILTRNEDNGKLTFSFRNLSHIDIAEFINALGFGIILGAYVWCLWSLVMGLAIGTMT